MDLIRSVTKLSLSRPAQLKAHFADDRWAMSGGVLVSVGDAVLNSLHLCLRRAHGPAGRLSGPGTQKCKSPEAHSGERGEGATLLPLGMWGGKIPRRRDFERGEFIGF